MRMLLIALFSVVIAAAAQAKNQGEPMKEAQNVQTLCLGRFLINVPKGTGIVASSSNYRWDSVSVTRQVSREKFLHFIADKEMTLKGTKHQEEPSLLKTISKGGDGNSAALVFWETPTSQRLYMTEAYKWSNGVQFLIKGESNRNKVPAALEMANRSLAELRFRRDGEIPSIPGFCIESGFFAGEPAMPHLERASLHLRLKDHPDVRIEIYTRTNGEKSEESLLARMGRKETPDFLKSLDAKSKILRQGQHPVGNVLAEEHLESIPTGDTFSTHMFFWESAGKPRDIYAPTIQLKMESGSAADYSITRPSVTDKQAMEIFDAIVDSIRIRPAGPEAASSAISNGPRNSSTTFGRGGPPESGQ